MNLTGFIDLADPRLGGKALAANDEFFAPKENLLKPGRGIFIEHKYTSRGKWMDGWETRRRRTPGFDWCLIKLGLRGSIRGVDIDTNHFLGNYPEYASLEACNAPANSSAAALLKKTISWTEVLSKSELKGGTQNLFAVSNRSPWTHARLNIYPDGGVARLRVHGEVIPVFKKNGASVDLGAIENGGLMLSSSDMFYGSSNNLLMPGRAKNMGDGWETKRRRGPGHDWAVIRLGTAGIISKIEVDTNHFKGNYPESCSLEGCYVTGAAAEDITASWAPWEEILPRSPLKAHKRHVFSRELKHLRTFTHVRFNIYPDGGVSRLRLHGKITGA